MLAQRHAPPSSPAAAAVPPRRTDVDERVILCGISWKQYVTLRDLLEEHRVRMTYLEGALEIMSPSRLHEGVKKRIARLLEVFALERDVPIHGYGSMTLKNEAKERGLEPDECYVVGKPREEGYPDLAIEVTVTSGGIDKLAVYRGFGVREVWIWEKGRIQVHALGDSGYEARAESVIIPGIDLIELARLVSELDEHAVLKAYRDSLRTR